jgi:hypothetical protein
MSWWDSRFRAGIAAAARCAAVGAAALASLVAGGCAYSEAGHCAETSPILAPDPSGAGRADLGTWEDGYADVRHRAGSGARDPEAQ